MAIGVSFTVGILQECILQEVTGYTADNSLHDPGHFRPGVPCHFLLSIATLPSIYDLDTAAPSHELLGCKQSKKTHLPQFIQLEP